MTMKIDDGRRLNRTVQEYVRKQSVKRYKNGERATDIARSYSVNRKTIYKWVNREAQGGIEALDIHPAPGAQRRLSDEQALEIRDMIVGKDPRDYGFESALWTRQIVSELIHIHYGINLQVTAVGELLHRLDIVPVRPSRRAYKRNPQAIEQWRRHTYPLITARAAQRDADVVFLDEMGIRSDSPLGTTWGEQGGRTEVKTPGDRQSISAISAVSYNGAFWFDTYSCSLRSDFFIEELKKLMHHRRRPLFIILDSHPAHRSKATAEYVQALKGKLELHFLPGYAPDLNPDEYIWNYVKSNGPAKRPLHQGESLNKRIHEQLDNLKAMPQKIRDIVQPIVNTLTLSPFLPIA
jgi:transposase